MKSINVSIVDAFAESVFQGNPAAVCITDYWLEDDLMQSIAMENNLSETAFLVKKDESYRIRWFTPTIEVDLCGHATLASAFVLFEDHGMRERIEFYSPRSGTLEAFKDGPLIYLDFPTDDIIQTDDIELLEQCIGIKPIKSFRGKTDFIAVVEHEEQIRSLNPNMSLIAKLPGRGLIVTSPGDAVDFVSRFFAPQSGVNEDPVTGSAHTSLTPLWSSHLHKEMLIAQQLSDRGGTVHCIYLGERCHIGGKAKRYLQGQIYIP